MTDTSSAAEEPSYYAIMTDSSEPGDKSHLARVHPCSRTPGQSFWTTNRVDDVWLLPKDEAEGIRDRLQFNNPRIVRAEKALKKIRAQAQEDQAQKEQSETVQS